MTTTVFTIFNDYFQKVPQWQTEAITAISQQGWDAPKTTIAMRIISSISTSTFGFPTGLLEANMDIFFSFSECNMQGRTAEDLAIYIESICKSINEFSRLHLRFRGLLTATLTGATMHIGWEF